MISKHTSAKRHRLARRLIFFATSLFLLSFILPAVSRYRLEPDPPNPDSTPSAAGKRTAALTQGSGAATVPGKARLRYQTRQQVGRVAEAPRIARNEQVILSIIQELDNQLLVPFDINISVEKCETPDSFYDPEAHKITICDEDIDALYFVFSSDIKNTKRLNEAVEGAVSTLFLHELGHALIDAYNLPITGREEDAVDQLSTLILINSTSNRERMALNGARAFELLAKLEDRHEGAVFWDEHSTNAQRYYDTICLIYGHDPEKYEYLVKNKRLPLERAETCSEDYDRVKNAWRRLLGPYAKQSLGI